MNMYLPSGRTFIFMRSILLASLMLSLGIPVQAEIDIEPIKHKSCSIKALLEKETDFDSCLEIEWGFIK